jgi:predicted permease
VRQIQVSETIAHRDHIHVIAVRQQDDGDSLADESPEIGPKPGRPDDCRALLWTWHRSWCYAPVDMPQIKPTRIDLMSVLRRGLQRLVAFFRPDRLDRELRDEIALHLELAADDYRQRGLSPQEAHRMAAMKLGAVDAAREQHREARGLPTLDSVIQDLGYALRGFRREPGFTLIAVLILALGIGANTAVFSVVNPLLLRPLPFHEAQQLMWLENQEQGGGGLSGRTFQVGQFEELSRNSRAFDDMSAYFAFFGFFQFTLTGHGEPERLAGVPVAPRFFELLGVQPLHGRLFVPGEHKLNAPTAVLLGYRLWQSHFHADPSIVGQAITVNDQPFTVVGILPSDFDFASTFMPGVKVDFFLAAQLDGIRTQGNTLSVVGRLKPGLSPQAGRDDIAELLPRLNKQHPEWGTLHARVSELKEFVSGRMRRSLFVLWGAVWLVLLIVCANLSNLLLARTAARSKEIAVRMALGAGRGRVLRHLLTEGVVLSLVAAVVSMPLAFALTGALADRAGLDIPLLAHVRVDGAALLFTALVAIVAGLAFGTLPALKVSGRDLHVTLKEHNRGSTDGRGHAWVRSSLVVVEVTLACVLLVGAGLLLRSFIQILDVDLGFQPTRAFAVRLGVPNGLGGPPLLARLDEAVRRVRAIPGVDAAGLTDALPLDRNRTWGIQVPGARADGRDDQGVLAFLYVVGPGYLQAMGIPLDAGREFTAEDNLADRPPVVLINESMARRLWPNQQAVGRQIRTGGFKQPLTIVGVVGDVRQSSLDEGAVLQVYIGERYFGSPPDLIVRSTMSPETLASSLRRTIGDLDSRMTTTDFRALDGLVERAVSPRRFLVTLLGGFSLLALTLACLGIYGVVSYTVSQRVQEIGIRMALGATTEQVCGQIIGGTVRLAAMGIAVGILISLGLARLIASLLFGTSPTDPATFAVTALALMLMAIVAGAIPAIRATRIDPMTALRLD